MTRPPGLLIAVAALVGLVACGDASPSGQPAVPAERTLTCERDARDFPQFEGEPQHRAVVRDRSGVVTGCRWIGMDEQDAMWPFLEPAIPDPAVAGRLHVAEVAGRESIILFWVAADCDSDAEVTASPANGGVKLELRQARRNPCAPGTRGALLELTTAGDVDATGALRYVRP